MFGFESVKSPFFSLFTSLEKNRHGQRPRRLRGFEQLEDRLALSVAIPSISAIPDEITIYAGSSWHYTAEEYAGFEVGTVDLEGLEAEKLTGRTVSITYEVTDAETAKTSELGTIVIQLFDDDAPNSADRFYRLADGSDLNFYQGRQVARIESGLSIIQAGGNNGTLIGDSGQPAIATERNWKLSQNSPGVVVFCGDSTGKVGDQFYMVWDTASGLDYRYNVLGFVVSGYDTLQKLSEMETKDRDMDGGKEKSDPVDKIVMKTVTVSETVSSDVFRISAAAGTSGSEEITLSITEEGGNVVQKTITVNVIDLKSADSGAEFDLELMSGTTTRIILPAKFGNVNDPANYYSASARNSNPGTSTSADNKLPSGVTLVNDSSGKYFEVSIDTTYSGAFQLALNISSGSSSAKTVYYNVFASPVAPVIEFSGETATLPAGEVTSSPMLEYVISNVQTGTDLYLTVKKDAGEEKPFQLTGASDYSPYYTRRLVNGLYEYTLTLTEADLRGEMWNILGAEESIDGTYQVNVFQTLDVAFKEHGQMRSETSADAVITVKSVALEVTPTETIVTTQSGYLSENEAMVPIEFELSEEDLAEGITLKSVVIDESALVFGNMKIDGNIEDGFRINWTPQESDRGREYNIPVKTIDSIGRESVVTIAFKLSAGPSFDILNSDGQGVSTRTVEVNELESVNFSIDLTGDDAFATTESYLVNYKLYRLGTGGNDEDATELASGPLSVEAGLAEWERVFTESEGYGRYRVEFTASYDGELIDYKTTKFVELLVKEVNVGPTITFVQSERFSVEAGTTEKWKLTATDPDKPAQPLVWSIDGEHPACLTIDSAGELTFAPTQAEAGKDFTVTVVVSDGDLTDSIELSFIVPDWVPEGDNIKVEAPQPLPALTTKSDCLLAWGNVNAYRLGQIQVSTDRFVAAFTGAAETFHSTVTGLVNEFNEGSISRDEYLAQCRQAAINKSEEQVRNVLNLETRNATINNHAREQYGVIAETGDGHGLDLPAATVIPSNEPIRLTYSQMQQLWQASLPDFGALSASMVDAVFSRYL